MLRKWVVVVALVMTFVVAGMSVQAASPRGCEKANANAAAIAIERAGGQSNVLDNCDAGISIMNDNVGPIRPGGVW